MTRRRTERGFRARTMGRVAALARGAAGPLTVAACGAAVAVGSWVFLAPSAPTRAPSWVENVEAEVGRGEYLFLPCRREMWVVNRTNGRIIHYVFQDNEAGTVQKSRVAAIDLSLFPTRDTDFFLSDRNYTPLLWVANRATGDFQLWRHNRDDTLTTDERHVPAADDLKAEPQGQRVRPAERALLPKRRVPYPQPAAEDSPGRRGKQEPAPPPRPEGAPAPGEGGD